MQRPTTLTDIDWTAVKQPYDAYLVLDVEATCMPGTDFNYANEIIEWPVCLLRWKYKDEKGKASRLEVVDEFRSFVKPSWRPQLSSFCTTLTGITQDDVDSAPYFATLMHTTFRDFLTRNGLIDAETGLPLVRFCWCSDGPWDIRDFVIPLPSWLTGDVLDVRRVVARWQERNNITRKSRSSNGFTASRGTFLPITRQLQLLGLGAFEGRQHCGIDDTRNVARIVVELARQGMPLKPNTPINPQRRWPWMGRNGKVLEEYVQPVTTSL
ncbi:ribonuclease H-like domain-containing protein [Irpex rosettiformis]|uniref:Ribonuclease H-like domain-containing protein n=1 Tax=Irpex rosettiformis TaxID=378272 RepID=A0ACB8TPS9_9APHY|nr:ribonuclease H-like domain-containing protein [Irpex rosettiformis]